MNQPIIHSSVFVAPGAFVTGDVVIGENSSVWYNAVLRGDMAQITIGKNTNVQDGCILHTDPGSPPCQTVPWSWATRQKLSAAFPPKSWKTCATMPMNILRCLKKC